MLLLTRRSGESLWINEEIKVLLVASDRGSARIGIAAPREMLISRTELLFSEPEVGHATDSQRLKSARHAISKLLQLKPDLADVEVDGWTVGELLKELDSRNQGSQPHGTAL